MEKNHVACHQVEEEGLSIREAERVIKSEMFLDEYPWWELRTSHQTVILHKMFLHAMEQGQKEAEQMHHQGHQSCIPEPNPKVDQSAMELVGYQKSRKEIWDVYHSVYLLWRCPGSPSCRALRRRRAIQDILSSLQAQVQRWTYSVKTKGPGAHGGEGVGTQPLQSYEVVLWTTHQKALATAKALLDDLERLNDKHRERSQACSQSRSWPRSHLRSHSRGHLRNCSRDQTGAHSQSPPHADSWGVHSPSLDGWPNRRVSFHESGDECSAAEEENLPVEPSVSDLEAWLEYQSTQIGTPVWWKELEAVPGITDQQKFAQKIQASFYILEVWSRMSPEEGCSTPPAPQSLNKGAYLPDNLAYQDVRWQPTLLTVAYCQCLQSWAEKCNLPRNPDFHPWA